MSNIFEIQGRYLAQVKELEDVIENTDFESEEFNQEEFDALLNSVTKDIEKTDEEAKEKIKAYYYVIKMKQSEIELVKDEIKRLDAKNKSKELLIKKLKNRVNEALETFGETGKTGNKKITMPDLTVFNVYHKPVIITDNFNDTLLMRHKIKSNINYEEIKRVAEVLNKEFNKQIEISSEPDMRKIKDELKAGKEVKGAYIDTNASYVRFK